MANTGMCYLNATGTEKDIDEGIHWMDKASEKGNGIASTELGDDYFLGNHVNKDISKAIFYYERGVKQRYKPAAEKLADIYENNGDSVRAEEYRNIAENMIEED